MRLVGTKRWRLDTELLADWSGRRRKRWAISSKCVSISRGFSFETLNVCFEFGTALTSTSVTCYALVCVSETGIDVHRDLSLLNSAQAKSRLWQNHRIHWAPGRTHKSEIAVGFSCDSILEFGRVRDSPNDSFVSRGLRERRLEACDLGGSGSLLRLLNFPQLAIHRGCARGHYRLARFERGRSHSSKLEWGWWGVQRYSPCCQTRSADVSALCRSRSEWEEEEKDEKESEIGDSVKDYDRETSERMVKVKGVYSSKGIPRYVRLW